MASKSRQNLHADGSQRGKMDKAKKLIEDQAAREAKECTFKPQIKKRMKVKQMAAAEISIRTPSESVPNKFGADMYKEGDVENILGTPTGSKNGLPGTPSESNHGIPGTPSES